MSADLRVHLKQHHLVAVIDAWVYGVQMTRLMCPFLFAAVLCGTLLASTAMALPLRLPLAEPAQECDYQTLAMIKKYTGEERAGGYYATAVHYFDETQREVYRVYVRDGLLVDDKGYPIDWKRAEYSDEHGAALMALYVMDGCGRIYLTYNHEVGIFQHSSFLAGDPVSSGGEALVIDGRLLLINNASGHYRPVPIFALQVIHRLKALGADLSVTTLDMVASPY